MSLPFTQTLLQLGYPAAMEHRDEHAVSPSRAAKAYGSALTVEASPIPAAVPWAAAAPSPAASHVAVLIPAYRPGPDLERLTSALLAQGFRVVVVNDGSGSDFDPVFATLDDRAVVLAHNQNLGKGCALRTGIAYILRNVPECFGIVTADADGQHSPEDIARVAARLLATPSGTRLILGSRHFEGRIPLRSRFGNTITRYVFAAATGVKLTDTQTGLRAFDLTLATQLLAIPGNRFEYELNVLLWAARQHVPIYEVAIRTVYIAGNATSHFNPLLDSIRIYRCILKFSLSSLRASDSEYATSSPQSERLPRAHER